MCANTATRCAIRISAAACACWPCRFSTSTIIRWRRSASPCRRCRCRWEISARAPLPRSVVPRARSPRRCRQAGPSRRRCERDYCRRNCDKRKGEETMAFKRMTVMAAAGLALASVAAFAAEPLRIGAMPVGSGWYVAAAALEQALKPEMGGTSVEIIARGGGVANPMVEEQGKAEIALSNVATSVWAMNGEELYKGKKATHIRSLIGGLNPVYMAMIVKNDFIKKTGLDTMDKIITSGKPLRIVMKPQGSNVPPTSERMC